MKSMSYLKITMTRDISIVASYTLGSSHSLFDLELFQQAPSIPKSHELDFSLSC